MLYQQIDDSDIKMLIYEIYRKILLGESLEYIISQFDYFEPLFITCFKILLHDNRSNKSLDNYLKISLDTLHFKGITNNKIIKITEIQNIISISVNPLLFIFSPPYRLLITDIIGITIEI